MARVLVVDDAAFMRKMVSDALVKAGHEVVGEATNGVEAVASYQALKPELTTLDITMPEKDGLTALGEIMTPGPDRQGHHVLRPRAGVQGPGVDQARRARLRGQAVQAPTAWPRRWRRPWPSPRRCLTGLRVSRTVTGVRGPFLRAASAASILAASEQRRPQFLQPRLEACLCLGDDVVAHGRHPRVPT